jgi:hypothetical protein
MGLNIIPISTVEFAAIIPEVKSREKLFAS